MGDFWCERLKAKKETSRALDHSIPLFPKNKAIGPLSRPTKSPLSLAIKETIKETSWAGIRARCVCLLLQYPGCLILGYLRPAKSTLSLSTSLYSLAHARLNTVARKCCYSASLELARPLHKHNLAPSKLLPAQPCRRGDHIPEPPRPPSPAPPPSPHPFHPSSPPTPHLLIDAWLLLLLLESLRQRELDASAPRSRP